MYAIYAAGIMAFGAVFTSTDHARGTRARSGHVRYSVHPNTPVPFLMMIAGFTFIIGAYRRDENKWKELKVTSEERRVLRSYMFTVIERESQRIPKPKYFEIYTDSPPYTNPGRGGVNTPFGQHVAKREAWNQAAANAWKGTEQYLRKLRDLFLKLSDGGDAITRESWDRACRKGRHASMWATGGHHEHDIATLLFKAADLDDNDKLSFKEFATVVVAAAAAHVGEVEAQAELLFMLIDEDHSGAIDRDELERFCALAVRLGVLRLPERMGGVLVDHREEERHLAEHILKRGVRRSETKPKKFSLRSRVSLDLS